MPLLHCTSVVCAFDSNHCAKIVKERIYGDPCHWQDVLPKLTTFWRVCILPEMLGRWYTRKCDLSCKVQQTLAGICFCRMPSDGNTDYAVTLTVHVLNFILLVWPLQPHFPRDGIVLTAAGYPSSSV